MATTITYVEPRILMVPETHTDVVVVDIITTCDRSYTGVDKYAIGDYMKAEIHT